MDHDLPDALAGGALALGDLLGEGAQGLVVRALDTEIGVAVAVKLVPQDQAGPRFRAEAEALSRLEHPHLVKVLEVGAEHGYAWFAMDYMPGGALDARVKADGPLPIPQALDMALDVLCGLAALHHAGIVHRDVKPGNVFFAADGRAVLGDLGIARMPRDQVAFRTGTGATLGTIDYAAPEQEVDATEVGPAADLYGVGASLFFAATGRRPAYLFCPDDVPGVLDGVPDALVPLVRRACEYEPGRRFADACAMAAEVARLRDPASASERMARFDALSPAPSAWKRLTRWLGL